MESHIKTLRATLRRLARDERGSETLEWGLLCGMILVGAIAVIILIGPKVTHMWDQVSSEIQKTSP